MDRFAAVCEEVAGASSRLRKIAIVADYLRSLSNEDFRLAVQFLSEGPAAQDASDGSLFETGAKNRLSIGYSILREALQAVCAMGPTHARNLLSAGGRHRRDDRSPVARPNG